MPFCLHLESPNIANYLPMQPIGLRATLHQSRLRKCNDCRWRQQRQLTGNQSHNRPLLIANPLTSNWTAEKISSKCHSHWNNHKRSSNLWRKREVWVTKLNWGGKTFSVGAWNAQLIIWPPLKLARCQNLFQCEISAMCREDTPLQHHKRQLGLRNQGWGRGDYKVKYFFNHLINNFHYNICFKLDSRQPAKELWKFEICQVTCSFNCL